MLVWSKGNKGRSRGKISKIIHATHLVQCLTHTKSSVSYNLKSDRMYDYLLLVRLNKYKHPQNQYPLATLIKPNTFKHLSFNVFYISSIAAVLNVEIYFP